MEAISTGCNTSPRFFLPSSYIIACLASRRSGLHRFLAPLAQNEAVPKDSCLAWSTLVQLMPAEEIKREKRTQGKMLLLRLPQRDLALMSGASRELEDWVREVEEREEILAEDGKLIWRHEKKRVKREEEKAGKGSRNERRRSPLLNLLDFSLSQQCTKWNENSSIFIPSLIWCLAVEPAMLKIPLDLSQIWPFKHSRPNLTNILISRLPLCLFQFRCIHINTPRDSLNRRLVHFVGLIEGKIQCKTHNSPTELARDHSDSQLKSGPVDPVPHPHQMLIKRQTLWDLRQ